MSLTSYRAAPPRVADVGGWRVAKGLATAIRYSLTNRYLLVKRKASVPCGPGDDLLSHVLRQSTIGAKAFDGRVRDGIGSGRLARATRPARNGDQTTDDGRQRTERREVFGPRSSDVCRLTEAKLIFQRRQTTTGQMSDLSSVVCHPSSERAFCARTRLGDKSNQAERAISTGQLRALPRFYIRPIDVVVFHGS
jgi:hypothetical protein